MVRSQKKFFIQSGYYESYFEAFPPLIATLNIKSVTSSYFFDGVVYNYSPNRTSSRTTKLYFQTKSQGALVQTL